MSTYKNLIGKDVNFLSTDPDNTQAEGQIWYNSTSGVFKDLLVNSAWVSASNLVSGRNQTAAAGTQDASILFGGVEGPPPNAESGVTQEYNGSGWSNGGSMSASRYELGGAGTQTAGLAFGGIDGGSNTTATEEYGGTSWTSGGALTQATYEQAGAGTQTAALAFGGQRQPEIMENNTQKYDGSSWTNTGSLNEARRFAFGFGIQTAAVAAGGSSPPTPNTTSTEEFNGSSWTTVNNMNSGRRNGGSSGILTAGLAYGGADSSPSNKTEEYNGTTWSVQSTLGTARYNHYGAGTDNATALYAAGGPPSGLAITEEYTRSINVITAAAWASGGALNTGRTALGGTGITTAAIAMGGGAPLNVQTEEYNSSSWTSSNNINTGRAIYGGAFGPQGAAGAASGEPTSTPAGTAYEEYDGSSWTNGPTLNIGRNGGISLGTQTAALCVAGFTGPAAPNSYIKTSESWNGSSWTSLPSPGSDTQTAGQGSGAGTTTAGLIFGRYDGAPNYTNKTDEYDGSSWTVGGVMNTARYGLAGSGAQTAAMASSGYNTGALSIAEGYDGNSWSTRPSVGSGDRYQVAGAGASNTDCIQFGGSGNSTATEEFTGETSALNIKTLTTS